MTEGGGSWRRQVLCIQFFLSPPTFWKIIMTTTAAAVIIAVVSNSSKGRSGRISGNTCYQFLLSLHAGPPFTFIGSVNSHTDKMYVLRLRMLKKPFEDKAIWGFSSFARIWLLKALN